jgi:SOS response associated peptidase (SRAP)
LPVGLTASPRTSCLCAASLTSRKLVFTSMPFAIVGRDGKLASRARWGLIPRWWKKTAKQVPSAFDARAEKVAEEPLFRSAFRRTPCIGPAFGCYEWGATEGGNRKVRRGALGPAPNDVLRMWPDRGPGVPRLGPHFPCDIVRTAVGMRKCCATAAIRDNSMAFLRYSEATVGPIRLSLWLDVLAP